MQSNTEGPKTVSATIAALERHRAELYNATVEQVVRLHDELIILRVAPDVPVAASGSSTRIQPGQYTTLGLGNWEPRVPGCQAEAASESTRPKLIKRAYSVSCPMLDARGGLVGVDGVDSALEFYIALVRKADHAPALTPRLFALHMGDRLFCGDHPHGHYSVDAVPASADVVFASTGTGEAPHNAMLVKLLQQRHHGQIVSVNCVRYKRDLGYLDVHRRLEQRFSNYQYIALTTREPENIDSNHPDYIGKRYIQDYFDSNDFTSQTGLNLDPATTHVFLCGNPEMIGMPLREQPAKAVTALLLERGFTIDQPTHDQPGNIHFEKFW